MKEQGTPSSSAVEKADVGDKASPSGNEVSKGADGSGSAGTTAKDAEETPSTKKRRFRRKAKDIQREHYCKFPGCGKSYGSNGSLTQHVR